MGIGTAWGGVKARTTLAGACMAVLLTACGGGGGGGGGSGPTGSAPPPPPPPPSGPTWTSGVFAPSSDFVARCENPRSGTSDLAGSTLEENFWLRSWSDETYLWYDEITDRNPADFNNTLDYFEVLKTEAVTPSGNPRDQFHFTFDTAEYQALVNSGASVEYGAEFTILQGTPPRDVRVAFTEPGSPAAAVSLDRGAVILEVDGVDMVNANSQAEIDVLNAGLFPSTAGESHTFTVRDLGSSTTRSITLTAQTVTTSPVNVSTVLDVGGDKVGYLSYITFGTNSAEAQLVSAMTDFANEGVTDIVVDLRYNGGGFLDIASQMGYMIAGRDQTIGRTFDNLVFNDKHPTINPVTGETLAPTPFHNVTQGFSLAFGQALPALDLSRVYILSTADTCSASEAVINGLRGIDVEVVLIGTRTCGKPYGFYATDNCGTTYFTIQFRGENDKGFGDYADGFNPANAADGQGELIAGCEVGDDFGHLLGDPDEAMLSAALTYRATGACPAVSTKLAASRSTKADLALGRAPEADDPTSLYSSPYLRRRLLLEEAMNGAARAPR